MVLSVDSGGAEPVSHDVVELSHSLSQAIPSLCLCVWISGSQLARSSYLEEGAKKEGRRETKFIWIEKWVAISRLHPFKQSVLVGMFQSSHYSWSVAKNFVPLFPFVFLFFLLSCYVRTSFYAAPAKYKLLGCRTVVGLGGCVRRAMAEEGRGGWEYLGSALGFASVWCVIVSACVCCVSKWDPNRKTSRTRMFRPSWGRCPLLLSPVSVLLHLPSSHFIMDHYHQSGGSSRGGVPPKFYQRSQSVVDRNGSADLTPPPLQQQQHEWPGPPVPVRSERRGAFRRRVSLFNKDTALPDVKIETTPLFPPQYHLYLLWAPRDLLYTPFLKGVGYLTTTRSTTRQKGVYFSSPS